MCILLVEDETLIRSIMLESLSEAGFDVLAFGSALEAIAAIEGHARHFTVLVTDMHLGDVADGLDIVRAMKLHYPAVPAVLATGRPDVLVEGDAAFTLLAKPYGVRDLLRTVTGLAN